MIMHNATLIPLDMRLLVCTAILLAAGVCGGVAAGQDLSGAGEEIVADIAAGTPGWELAGTGSALRREGACIAFDASRAGDDGYRWGGAKLCQAFGGDFEAEGDLAIEALDHWNSTGMQIVSQQDGGWRAVLLRRQLEAGRHDFLVQFKQGNEVVYEHSIPDPPALPARFTLRIARNGGVMSFGWRDGDGAMHEAGRHDGVPEGDCHVNFSFDSPAATSNKTRVEGVRIRCGRVLAGAFAPSYGPLGQLGEMAVLYSEKAARDGDGVWTINAGGRLIAAVETAVTTRAQTLKWQSQGLLRIRMMVPGSSESLQLSDNVVFDQPEDKVPSGFAARSAWLEPVLLRFNGERQWNLPHFTTSGLFFFEIAPAQDGGQTPVRVGDLQLWGHEMVTPPPFKAAVSVEATGGDDAAGMAMLSWAVPESAARVLDHADRWPEPAQKGATLDGVPYRFNSTILSPECPSIELLINRRAGMVHLLHAAGAQPKDGAYSEVVAGYLLVYDDGTTAPALATLRWNCGVYAAGDYDRYGFMTAGPGQGNASATWWGPPRFGWANALYLPRPPYGFQWNAFYAMNLRNPHPEKKIRSLIAYQMPGDTRQFALVALTLRRPEATVVGLAEPERAAIADGVPTGVNFYEYRAVASSADAEHPVEIVKSEPVRQEAGLVVIHREGRLGAGHAVIAVDSSSLDAGPAVIAAGDLRSSRISLMGVPSFVNPFYYMMIAGGHEHFSDFDRIVRIGFDAVKVHIGWELDDAGDPDFSQWPARFERIGRAGLKVAIRNLFVLPEEFRTRIPRTRVWRDGKVSVDDSPFNIDTSNPFYREKVVDYYRRVGQLAAAAPNVMGINANYGQQGRIGEMRVVFSDAMLAMLAEYLERTTTVEQFNRKSGLDLKSFRQITPQQINGNAVLFAAYSRANEEIGSQLIEDIAAAIRSTGCNAHLTFNVNFHPIENKLSGQTFAQYLRIGVKYPPASLFHETSERYNISFLKWLCAKRTFGLPYGDEVGQPPPTYEHAVLGYMWMGMFQCFESNYCQWWGGKPGTQNLAQLKGFHKLLYEAQYLPDPVSLALSLETGHDEVAETNRHPLHTRAFDHYGMVNALRELNINSDRAMIDDFPEKDAEISGRLLIDDHTRHMPAGFADRIEKFVNDGGVYLASAHDTDRAFLARFGLGIGGGEGGIAEVDGADEYSGRHFPVAEKQVGRGRVVVMRRAWAHGWDPGRPEDERAELLALLKRLGGFEPLVQCSFPTVYVTPYRAANGDLLISCINVNAEDKTVAVSFARSLAGGGKIRVRDLNTGAYLPVTAQGGNGVVGVTVPAINTTVLRVTAQ